jgi:hypothetical protein
VVKNTLHDDFGASAIPWSCHQPCFPVLQLESIQKGQLFMSVGDVTAKVMTVTDILKNCFQEAFQSFPECWKIVSLHEGTYFKGTKTNN